MSGSACTARPGLSPSSLCVPSGYAGNGNDVPEPQGFSPHLLVPSYTGKLYDCLSNAKLSGKAKKDLYIQIFPLLWAAWVVNALYSSAELWLGSPAVPLLKMLLSVRECCTCAAVTVLYNYFRVYNLHRLQLFRASEESYQKVWTTFWSVYCKPWPMTWQKCQSSLGKFLWPGYNWSQGKESCCINIWIRSLLKKVFSCTNKYQSFSVSKTYCKSLVAVICRCCSTETKCRLLNLL